MTLYLACLLTVVIETAFFLAAGYRDRYFVTACVSANVVTNLSLNLALWYLYGHGVNITLWVLQLELLAAAAEYAVYALIKGPSARLLGLTAAANAISYFIGIALFGGV